jgi:hypothetical protein
LSAPPLFGFSYTWEEERDFYLAMAGGPNRPIVEGFAVCASAAM